MKEIFEKLTEYDISMSIEPHFKDNDTMMLLFTHRKYRKWVRIDEVSRCIYLETAIKIELYKFIKELEGMRK